MMDTVRHGFQIFLWITTFFLGWTIILTNGGTAKNSDLKLVCYYSNWAIYRPSLAKFTPENINPYLCTHLIYAFAGMNKDYELKPFDSWNDIQQGNYKKFTNLKTYNPKLKLLIAVGGWNEGSKRFSKLVETSQNRLKFVRGAISFLRKHGFDGLDLDWEYPGFRDGGQDEDKEGYAKLVTELRDAIDAESVPRGKSRLLLTMAVPAGQQYIDKGYDIPVLSRNLDFFNLLTYDYHTSTEALIDHHAPLGERPGLEDWDPNRQFNIKWTIKYYIKKGADRKKLILGIPTYGRSFTLEDPDEYEIGSAADGPGEKGVATREKGYLSYYEICQKIQDEEWELEAPYPQIMGPYAFKDNQWVGFDDEDIIIEKVKFILSEGLGGGMVWTLDNDDFRGTCYGEQSPLINTLKSALFDGTTDSPTTRAPSSPTTKRTPRRQQQRKTTPKRDKSTTVAPFTTPDPGPPFECEDEGFFNNPTDCKKYFWCLDSGPSNLGIVPHAFTCPSGLFFNKKRDACDYAGNVVCRVKTTAATTTTPKPRPRPRKKTTTTTTTTTTTPKPPKVDIPKDIQNDLASLNGPLNAIKINSQSLSELLELLQNLGVNKIQDKLSNREPEEISTTPGPTLPQYRSPNRRNHATTEATDVDPFAQYAKPDRSITNDKTNVRSTVRPRGPQYKVPESEAHHSAEDDAKPPPEDKNGEFPFVYHTPSRYRTTIDPKLKSDQDSDLPEDEEYDEEEDFSTPKPTTQTSRKNNRRVVVRVRPATRDNKKQNPPGTLLINSNSEESPANRGNNNYVLAQTIGVRRVARPVNNNEESPREQSPTSKPTRRSRLSQSGRVNKDTTSDFSKAPDITQLVSNVKPSVPSRSPNIYQVTVPSGRPARPATKRTQRPHYEEAREPALALLPDGGITCLRRGVYPHPMDCAKFLVCVPAEEENEEYDGFIHTCPTGSFFKEGGGRCTPGERSSCKQQQKS